MAQHGSRPALPGSDQTTDERDIFTRRLPGQDRMPGRPGGRPASTTGPGRRRVYPPAEGPPQKAPPPEASLGAPPSVPCTSAAPAHNDPPPNGEASDFHVLDRARARRYRPGTLTVC